MTNTKSNKKIALNTAVIYCRLIITLGVTLFSTRFVLEALGETDFGLFNVVAGIVTMFSFISGTMATTTQRFISFTMGECNNLKRLKAVVGSSLTLHFLVSLLVALVVLIGGWILIDKVLTIPPEKHTDAIFVLCSVSIGLIATVNSVPFEALLMAHENITFVAICQVLNAIIKFGGAVLLLYTDCNRLRIYALIMAGLPYIVLLLEAGYCLFHYDEAKINKSDLKPTILMKQLGVFAGWIMIGTAGMTIQTQGISIILNIFFGVVINAANGIASQINTTLQFFSTSITTSLRPQLVMSAGGHDENRFLSLLRASCKYPFLLISVAGVPLIVTMPYVLSIWLTEVPPYTVNFCRLLIVSTTIRQLYLGLIIGLEANNNIKQIETFLGIAFVSILPVGYFLIKAGYNPNCIYWCLIIIQSLILIYSLHLSKRYLKIKITNFINDIIMRGFSVCVLSLIFEYFIWKTCTHNFCFFAIFIVVSTVIFCGLTYILGLNPIEKSYIRTILKAKIHPI